MIDLNEFCKTLQKKLNAQAIRDDNSVAPDQGTLAFLMSALNKNAIKFEAKLDQGDGKVKTGRVRFLPRGTKAEYDNAIDGDICAPGDTLGYMYEPYSIDEVFTSVKLTFKYNEMRDFCEGKDNHIAEVIYSRMKAARSALNKKVVTKILNGGYIGKFANGVAGPKALPLFHTTDNKINPLGEITIEQDMTDAEISGSSPMLIGANLMQSYATMKGIQCCNSEQGYNAGMLNQVKGWMLDKTYDSILGTSSNVLAFIPGALQIITTNYNRGEFEIIQPDHTHTTIADTLIDGLVYDLYTHLVKCDPTGENDVSYQIQWKLRWDLWGYPDALFAVADELNGVKDVFHYVAGCGDDNVCDLASQQAAPVAAFSQSKVGDVVTFDTTGSSAQAPGAVLVSFTWDFGGTVKTGAPAATITGLAGVTGTYDAPVIDHSDSGLAIGAEICLVVQDDNLKSSTKFCDELI